MAKLTALCAIIGCTKPAADRHHIGGPSSPMIWVCRECHGRIHSMSWEADHAALVKAGLERARKEGRIGGNPRLRLGASGREKAIQNIAAKRAAAHAALVVVNHEAWLPIVQRMRPHEPWIAVVDAVNIATRQHYTVPRLRRMVATLINNGLTDAGILQRAPLGRPIRGDTPQLRRYIARLAEGSPKPSLQQIASQLEAIGILTPHGRAKWQRSSVHRLLNMQTECK